MVCLKTIFNSVASFFCAERLILWWEASSAGVGHTAEGGLMQEKKKKEAALGSCVKSYLSIRQGDSVALFMNGDWCRPCLCNAKCSWNDFFRILYQREKYDGIKHSLIISLKEPEATTKSELKVTPPLNVMKYLRGPNNSYEAFSTEKENKKRHFHAENMDKNPDTVRSDIYLCRLQC